MKVYVIQEGCYSDRHIVGVTLNENIAEAYLKIHNTGDWYDDCNIEEYELLDDVNIITEADSFVKQYIIYIQNNNLASIKEECYVSPDTDKISYSFNNDFGMIIKVIEDSKEKALKIAYDLRAKKLAEKFGL